MDTQLNPTQTNTREGVLPIIANVDLTGKEGYLAKIVSNSGTPNAALPTALTDTAPYVIAAGDVAGNQVFIEAPGMADNFRVVAKGTGTAGTLLSLADPGTPADAGKLRAVPTTTGTWYVLAIAEEDFVDGQLVKCRRYDRVLTVA